MCRVVMASSLQIAMDNLVPMDSNQLKGVMDNNHPRAISHQQGHMVLPLHAPTSHKVTLQPPHNNLVCIIHLCQLYNYVNNK